MPATNGLAGRSGPTAVLRRVARQASAGEPVARSDLIALAARMASPAAVLELAAASAEVRAVRRGGPAELCGLVNAKSGACPEDCAYCAQARGATSGTAVYALLPAEAQVARALEVEAMGADHVCLVMSGRGPSPEELSTVERAAREIRRRTRLRICGCLGILGVAEARRLADAGVTRYNHNLETSERFYPRICTTHTWRDRYDTARAVRAAGLELCCGGILGMGETVEDRIDLGLALRTLDPAVVTLNLLTARPGTPLAGLPPPAPLAAVGWVALFRLMLPAAVLKLAGGREPALRELQGTALLAGADGLIIGGYLTSAGRPVDADRVLLADAGLATAAAIR